MADRFTLETPIWADELATAVAAAQEAGELLRRGFRQPTRERRKGSHDVVTALDLASERLIMGRLGSRFPTDARLGEETGLSVPTLRQRPDGARTWIVDPLDGTVNFASGIPFWCVSIALAVDGQVVVGVIADPLRDELYGAVRGQGAWRLGDGVRLEVRRICRVADAVVLADPGRADDREADERVAVIRSRVRSVRALGSVALSLTLLASGRVDGVVQVRGLGAVDIAAAGLLASEAGAVLTDAEVGPWLVVAEPNRGTGIVAARSGLHRVIRGPGHAGHLEASPQAGSPSSK
ncbi:MAG: inositol monophosphatase family protein [Candidatus Limnocylindrales bacterium]